MYTLGLMQAIEAKVVLPARVPPAQRDALRRLANAHGCTISDEIRRALAAHIDRSDHDHEEASA